MRFLFALLSLLGFAGLGVMVFLSDPFQLDTFEFFLLYASFFLTLGSLFALFVLLVGPARHSLPNRVGMAGGQQLRRGLANAVRQGALFGAAITFLLFLQSMRTLNVVPFIAVASIAVVAELLFRVQKRIRKT